MTAKLLLRTALVAALFFGATIAPQLANASAFYDSRPILVEPPPHALRGRDCPTCYKGHDFGHDCFQYVWNGFENIWSNVCLWGWH
jgi:hypothetical protein